jgi:hypothetical protein
MTPFSLRRSRRTCFSAVQEVLAPRQHRCKRSERDLAQLEHGIHGSPIATGHPVNRVEVGSRQEEPDFGVTDQAFRQNGADLEELEAVAGTWEPRASLLNEVAWDQLVETVTTEVSANE